VLTGAAGVHVGQDDISPSDVRTILGPDSLIGLSTHTYAQVETALTEPIGYLATGPVFGTGTKETGYLPIGLEAVHRTAGLCQAIGLPVVAIGGITLARARDVLDAGATSLAVISDLLTTDPEARVAEYLSVLR
jgi:thiamine-phosphate pyrophosphorylase